MNWRKHPKGFRTGADGAQRHVEHVSDRGAARTMDFP